MDIDAPRAVLGHLPLRPRVFAMLANLADGPRHGYDLMQRVNENLGRRSVLGPGTLYRVLKELRDLGWIDEVPAPEPGLDPRRRYYGLTALGRSVVDAEAARVAALIRVVRAPGALRPLAADGEGG